MSKNVENIGSENGKRKIDILTIMKGKISPIRTSWNNVMTNRQSFSKKAVSTKADNSGKL